MTHVATPRPNLGAALGQGLGQGLGQSLEQYSDRQMTKRGLDKLRNAPAGSPTDQLYNLIEASTYSPAIGKSLGPLYQTLIEQQNRNNAANVPLTGGSISTQGQQPSQGVQQQLQGNSQMGGQIGAQGRGPNEQAQKFFPSNVGPNEAPGNAPQEATGGQVKPVWNGEELLQQAELLNQKWRKAGVTDRSLEDALRIKEIENQGNIAHNQRVENERLNRIAEQEAFGNVGEEYLKNVLPTATDEQKALFRKKGEDVSGKGKSQADIKRTLAKEATQFKNTISNIEKGLSAPRIQTRLQRKISGNEKTIDQAKMDARAQIQPLLQEGLYDTSRSLLADAGFYPEERESIVFGEPSKDIRKTVNAVPKPIYEKINKPNAPAFLGGYNQLEGEKKYSPESKENLKENILSVWGPEKTNKDVNPILLRKEYEDKGYNWRIYKDAMNDLFSNGQIEFTDDQENQFNSYLGEPPLTMLEGIFETLGLRGR